jgi:hypothetical protein
MVSAAGGTSARDRESRRKIPHHMMISSWCWFGYLLSCFTAFFCFHYYDERSCAIQDIRCTEMFRDIQWR